MFLLGEFEVPMRCYELRMHDGEGVAEEEICEDLNDIAYQIKLISLFEEFDKEEDESSNGIDR